MGGSLGALLARAELRMRDWDADEDGPDPWGLVEFLGIGAIVAYIYVALIHDMTGRLLTWLS
jgi:hypothetical protein